MKTFIDSIGLWIFNSSRHSFDAMLQKNLLSVLTFEIGALIICETHGARIPREPSIGELLTDMSSTFVVNANEFGVIRYPINNDECQELVCLTSDSYFPRTNQVDGDFMPRSKESLSRR